MSDLTDYHPLWSDLGLDLDAHDALLGAVGQLFQDVYLSQNNRPKGMDYLNFVMSEVHGLRIKELDDFRKQGGKVFGTFCLYVPEEIIRAAGPAGVQRDGSLRGSLLLAVCRHCGVLIGRPVSEQPAFSSAASRTSFWAELSPRDRKRRGRHCSSSCATQASCCP